MTYTDVKGLKQIKSSEIRVGDKVEVLNVVSGSVSLYMCVPAENDLLKLVSICTGMQANPFQKSYKVGDKLEGIASIIMRKAKEVTVTIDEWE